MQREKRRRECSKGSAAIFISTCSFPTRKFSIAWTALLHSSFTYFPSVPPLLFSPSVRTRYSFSCCSSFVRILSYLYCYSPQLLLSLLVTFRFSFVGIVHGIPYARFCSFSSEHLLRVPCSVFVSCRVVFVSSFPLCVAAFFSILFITDK